MFSKFFKKKSNFKQKISNDTEYNFIYQSDVVNDIFKKSCPNGQTAEDIESYISDNISEISDDLIHSNVIVEYKFKSTAENLKELSTIYENLSLFKSKVIQDDEWTYLILSGSIYAYRNLITICKDADNKIFKIILLSMYNINKCFFQDFIEADIMNQLFIPRQYYVEEDKHTLYNPKRNDINMINLDSIELIQERLSVNLPIVDLIDLISATIEIKIPIIYENMVYGNKSVKYDKAIFVGPAGINNEYEKVSIAADEQVLKRLIALGIDCRVIITSSVKELLQFIDHNEKNFKGVELSSIAKQLKEIIIDNFKQFTPDLIKPRYELRGRELEEELDIDEPIGDIKEETINDNEDRA